MKIKKKAPSKDTTQEILELMKTGAAVQKDRDQQILSRLGNLEHKVDSIDQTNAFALRADSERHAVEMKKIFTTSKRRAQIYLAADGVRSVEEIANHLGMQRQNVGPDLKHLGEEGLLDM